MKTVLEREDIQAIAEEVIERIQPIINEYVEQTRDDEILTIDEMIELFKLKKSQIYYWVSESKYVEDPIPYMKAGKHLRFSKKDVTNWMKIKTQRVDMG